jgi:hypothetical protein
MSNGIYIGCCTIIIFRIDERMPLRNACDCICHELNRGAPPQRVSQIAEAKVVTPNRQHHRPLLTWSWCNAMETGRHLSHRDRMWAILLTCSLSIGSHYVGEGGILGRSFPLMDNLFRRRRTCSDP